MAFNVKTMPTLAPELQGEILQYFSIPECWRLAGVCKGWRRMVFNWEPFWFCLSTKPNRYIFPDMAPYKSFMKSRTVKRISIHHGCGDEANIKNGISFIQEQAFYAITEVDIVGRCFIKEEFIKLADVCGKSLTHITIGGLFEMDSDGVRPDIILQRCPNLVKLDFRGSIYNEKWAHQLAGFKHQNLSDASLRFYTADFDIQPFLKATPKLRRLCLRMSNPGLGRSLPESIQKYCPELEAFILYMHTDQLDDSDESSQKTFMSGKRIVYTDSPKNSTVMGPQLEKQDLKGLQYIVFQEELAHSEASSIILLPLVEKFNKQLISLDLGKPGCVNDDVLSHISELIFPSLKYLTLKGSSPWDVSSVSSLRSMFEHGSVPNLTHIALHQLDTIVDTVLDAITSSCPHLHSILLDNCQGITTDGMIRFLNRLTGQLREITIEQSGFALTPRVLECMGTQLQVLECLTIEAFQYDFLALADVERYLDIRNHEQKKKKNSDRKMMERLDIYFVFDSSSDYPGKARVDRLLEKMDSSAKEWSYTMVMPYEEVQVILDCGEDIYDQITHVEFRRRKKRRSKELLQIA